MQASLRRKNRIRHRIIFEDLLKLNKLSNSEIGLFFVKALEVKDDLISLNFDKHYHVCNENHGNELYE